MCIPVCIPIPTITFELRCRKKFILVPTFLYIIHKELIRRLDLSSRLKIHKLRKSLFKRKIIFWISMIIRKKLVLESKYLYIFPKWRADFQMKNSEKFICLFDLDSKCQKREKWSFLSMIISVSLCVLGF